MTQCSDMMTGAGGWMMIGAGLTGFLIIVVLLLSIAALAKYLRTPTGP